MSARPAPPGLATGAWRILTLSLDTALASRSLVLPALILAVLPLVATLGRPSIPPELAHVPAGVAVFHRTMLALYLGPVTMLVTLLLATAALGDELERRTLVHLITRPVSRGALYLGKLASLVAMSWAMVSLSLSASLMVLTTRLGGELGTDYLVTLLAVELVAALAYGTLFFLASLTLPFATLAGLAYGFGLEVALTNLPGYFAWGSIGYHARRLFDAELAALHPVLLPKPPANAFQQLLAAEVPEPAQSAWILAGFVVVTFAGGWLSCALREFNARLGKSD